MNFCPKCGASVKEEAEFCHNCGYNLKTKSSNIEENGNLEGPENLEEKVDQFKDKLGNIKSVLNNKISIGIIIACAFIIIFIFLLGC